MAARSGPRGAGLGFNALLLLAVVLLMATGVGIGLTLYLRPPGSLVAPGNEPAVRVAAESDFPVGASRVQNWDGWIVLVVRRGEREYFAVQGTSPADGCILAWDAVSQRIVSPCQYAVYDLHGNVVAGLSTEPLHRFPVFVRDGVVYVTRGPADPSR